MSAGRGWLTGEQVALIVRVNSVGLGRCLGGLLAEQIGRFVAGTVRLGDSSAHCRRVALQWRGAQTSASESMMTVAELVLSVVFWTIFCCTCVLFTFYPRESLQLNETHNMSFFFLTYIINRSKTNKGTSRYLRDWKEPTEHSEHDIYNIFFGNI